jgi:phage repressor protein C with HTH and peptisase S24 domain
MSRGNTFAERVALMIAAVGGNQKELARIGDLSDATLINWKRGLGVRPTRLADFAARTGVPLEWLRDGRGDPDEVLAPLRNREESGSVREDGHHGRTSPREKILAALDRRRWTTSTLTKAMGYDDAGAVDYALRSGRVSESMIENIVRVMPELAKGELMDGSDSPTVRGDGLHGTHGAKSSIKLPPGMKGRTVPLLSMAQAGAWDAGHDDGGWTGEGVFALNVDDRRAFAISVSGNSMEPEIRAGDVVICSPRAELSPGCVAVVRTHSGQAFIKFWRQRGETVSLESANPAYDAIKFPLAEIAGAWPVVQRIASGKITQSAK